MALKYIKVLNISIRLLRNCDNNYVKLYLFWFGFVFSQSSFTNKNIIMSSFKSSRDIQKKEGGPDSCFG